MMEEESASAPTPPRQHTCFTCLGAEFLSVPYVWNCSNRRKEKSSAKKKRFAQRHQSWKKEKSSAKKKEHSMSELPTG